jgi:hypothetical protein
LPHAHDDFHAGFRTGNRFIKIAGSNLNELAALFFRLEQVMDG